MRIHENEVKQISRKLYEENVSISDNDLSEDISCIVYRNDVFECDNFIINNRHIDIEYSFGEYYEVCVGTSLFEYICALCNLPLLQGEKEIKIYQKGIDSSSSVV